MLIKIRTSADVPSSEITPEHVYRSRREFIAAAAGAIGAAAGALAVGGRGRGANAGGREAHGQEDVLRDRCGARSAEHPRADHELTTTSTSSGRARPTRRGTPARLTVKPWTVKVDGLVKKPGDYGVEDLVDFNQLEERVYRLRCVEAWSMVIPWIGVPLSAVLNKVGPQPARSSSSSRRSSAPRRCRAS